MPKFKGKTEINEIEILVPPQPFVTASGILHEVRVHNRSDRDFLLYDILSELESFITLGYRLFIVKIIFGYSMKAIFTIDFQKEDLYYWKEKAKNFLITIFKDIEENNVYNVYGAKL